MALTNSGLILAEARAGGYCVGAFNVIDFLTMEAVIRIAEKRNSPVILQTSTPIVKRYGASRIVRMVQTIAEDSEIPVGLHLDHGTDTDVIRGCIEAGYTSVMIDASHYPFEENVRRTRTVVELAHQNNAAVEGEIGILAGVEDDIVIAQDDAIYTTPAEAIEFQEQSGVDFLAVAIGTAHGFYKVAPRLDIETLHEIHSKVSFPLVVHGGTGLSFDTVRELVEAGASKFNLSTQLKKTYIDSLQSYMEQHQAEYNPLKMLDYAQDQLKQVICEYLDVFGSSNKA